MRQRALSSARLPDWQPRIIRKALSRPQGQAQTRLHFKERYGSVLELVADDALRFQAETILVEAHGSVQVVYCESDQCYARLHETLRGNVISVIEHSMLNWSWRAAAGA